MKKSFLKFFFQEYLYRIEQNRTEYTFKSNTDTTVVIG